MIPLSQLLNRFKNINNSEKQKKQLIVDILSLNSININLNQISLSKNVIIVKTGPIIKTEILIKKEYLIKKINETRELSNILDIK